MHHRIFEQAYTKRDCSIEAKIEQYMDKQGVYHALVQYRVIRLDPTKKQVGNPSKYKTLDIVLNGSGNSKMFDKVKGTLLALVQ
ncbi:MAG: hypothetical protein V1743_04200 [Nanoarchaeota archaeon]